MKRSYQDRRFLSISFDITGRMNSRLHCLSSPPKALLWSSLHDVISFFLFDRNILSLFYRARWYMTLNFVYITKYSSYKKNRWDIKFENSYWVIKVPTYTIKRAVSWHLWRVTTQPLPIPDTRPFPVPTIHAPASPSILYRDRFAFW